MSEKWFGLIWGLALVACMGCNEAGGLEEEYSSSGAQGLSSAALASSSSSGFSSSSDVLALAISASDPWVWDVNGRVSTSGDIVDVSYTLRVNGAPVSGAVVAYALQAIWTSDAPLQELELGLASGQVPGLETEIMLRNVVPAACAEGEDSLELDLTVGAYFVSPGILGGDTAYVEGRVVSRQACPLVIDNTEEKEPVVYDVPLKDQGLVVLGGAKATPPSSWDLDSLKSYGGASVEGEVANRVDLVYSGSKLMTPIGTTEANYMASRYASSTSVAFLQKLSAEQAAKAKDLQSLENQLDANQVVFATTVAQGDYFLLATSDMNLMLLQAELLNEQGQVLSLRVWSGL